MRVRANNHINTLAVLRGTPKSKEDRLMGTLSGGLAHCRMPLLCTWIDGCVSLDSINCIFIVFSSVPFSKTKSSSSLVLIGQETRVNAELTNGRTNPNYSMIKIRQNHIKACCPRLCPDMGRSWLRLRLMKPAFLGGQGFGFLDFWEPGFSFVIFKGFSFVVY